MVVKSFDIRNHCDIMRILNLVVEEEKNEKSFINWSRWNAWWRTKGKIRKKI